MFALRTTSDKTKVESNYFLGKNYRYVKPNEENDLFVGCVENLSIPITLKPNIYAVIIDQDDRVIPLFNESDNYIMTDSGRTFARV